MREGENSVVQRRFGPFIRSSAYGTMGSWLSLHGVTQCAAVAPYRPAALRKHDDFKDLYPPTQI
jgi:hypothetical protein